MTAICLLSSAAMIHVAIIWGTNNIPPQLRPLILPSLTPLDIKHRVLGSKLILAARVMYICRYVKVHIPVKEAKFNATKLHPLTLLSLQHIVSGFSRVFSWHFTFISSRVYHTVEW
jgi:hypothetical protein